VPNTGTENINLRRGFFPVDAGIRIVSPKFLQGIGKYLTDKLSAQEDVKTEFLTAYNSSLNKAISLHLEENSLPEEGCRLEVDNSIVSITGGGEAGVFYGCQTLLQLIKGKRIPCISIEDYPEVSWRGMMIDVARHFFAKDYIFKIIDILAMHKR